MAKALTLFNHKGGVGKTTLTVNLADAFAEMGLTVLLVDTDPQCNLSAFYLDEKDLDDLLGESDEGLDEDGGEGTVWSAVKPVVEGTGGIEDVNLIEVADKIWLAPGDVLVSKYEEELAAAWTESFARKVRGYNVMTALYRMANAQAEKIGADIILYDVGPNVGSLNRAVLLSCDCFVTPVHTDLYSLRALTTVGQSLSRWVSDWKTIRKLAAADPDDDSQLPLGLPRYLGYISTAFKVYGRTYAKSHQHWEGKLPHRVKTRLVDRLRDVDETLTSALNGKLKVGKVKHFASAPAAAQEAALPLRRLPEVQPGKYREHVAAAEEQFASLAREIIKRMER